MKGDDHFFLEETEHAKDKKSSRKERKRLSEKDRSKYKKTDVEKQKVEEKKEGLFGRVLQIKPEGIVCQINHEELLCTLKGNLKKEKRLSKSLIAVGDEVVIDQATLSIIQILPRKTVLSRADNLSRKKEQVIASNIDQVFITVSILEPTLKPFLIDRYLIAAYKGNLNPIILITKIDLISLRPKEEQEFLNHQLETIKTIAESLSIPILFLSSKDQKSFEALKALAKDKTSVFSGQSGVGKSTLINALTGATQRAAPVVSRTQKGSHTTTQAIMLPLLDIDGYCVDTPGIRSFGLWEIDESDIGKYFKEIDEAAKLCKYPDCKHLTEPDCSVKIEVEKGNINPLRFESYCVLMAEARSQHMKR